MRIAIMQPYVFPFIGYFQLISAVDKFVLYDDVNYINRGWINRNNLLVNGVPYLFSIPLKHASQNRLINDNIEIIDFGKWVNKFFKTLEGSYKKAPFFYEVVGLLESVLIESTQYIHTLAAYAIVATVKYLNLETEIILSSTQYQNAHLKGQARILDICKKEAASDYINPIGGIEIYSRELFEIEQVKLNFLKTNSHTYKQFGHAFVPYLSIIDVMMFNSKSELQHLLTEYTLL